MACGKCDCKDCKALKKKKLKTNCCINCGNNEIRIHNCGYTTFNCGSGKCLKCGNEVQKAYGPTGQNDWLIKEWNRQNPTKEEEIASLKKQILKIKEKIKKAEARVW